MALAIDGSSPALASIANTGAAVTTASFTPPAGSQLWVGSVSNGSAAAGTFTVTSSPALTFTQRVLTTVQEVPVAWHVADVSVSQAYTVTSTRSDAGGNGMAILVRVITGQESSPGGATATANSNSGLPSQTITTTRAGSLILAASADWADQGLGTAGTSQTILGEHRPGVGNYTGHFWRYDGLPAISTYTINLTAPAAQDYNLAVVEIREAPAATVQQLPSTDEATNSWTNQAGSGTSIYQAIDEAAADDSDYVQSALAASSGSFYETKLTSAVDPALSTDHVLHYRYRASPAYGSTNVTVSLRQGASTQIATATNTSIGGAWTAADVALSGGEADAITDYSDLRIRIAPTGAAASAQTPARVANTTLTASNLTSQGATTVTVDSTAAAAIFPGHYMIAAVAVDNSGGSGARPGLTVTDSQSHTWTVTTGGLQDPGAINAGAACYIAYTKVTSAYAASNTITFTWGAGTPTAKAISVAAFAGIHQSVPVAVTETTANAGSTAFSLGITPNAANQLVFAVGAIEGPSGDTWTNDADSTNGSWTAITEVSTGNTGVGDMTLQAAFKAVSASGAQTWNSTITNRDWCANAIVFAPDAAGSRVQVSWANLTVPESTDPDATATPDAVALTATLNAPTVTARATTTPAAVALTATLNAPTNTAGATTTPSVVALTSSLTAPTATAGATVTPATVAVAATLNAPTVELLTEVTPASVALSAALTSPTVSAGATTTPAAVALTATLNAATATAGATTTPASVALSATLNAPTVTLGVTATPASVALSATLNAPTATAGAATTPSATTLAATLNNPTVTAGATVTPSAVALSVVVNNPSVSAGGSATAVPDAVALSTTLNAPTVTGAATVSPPGLPLLDENGDPLLDENGDPLYTETGIGLAVAVNAPTVTLGVTATPASVTLAVTANAPTVSAGATTTPGSAALAAAVNAPTISTGVTVTPDAVVLVLAVNGPAASAGATVTPDTVALAVTVNTPGVSAGGSVTAVPDAVVLAVAVNAPTVTLSATATPSTLALTAAPTSATVTAGATVLATVIALVVVANERGIPAVLRSAVLARVRSQEIEADVQLSPDVDVVIRSSPDVYAEVR